MKIDQLEFNRLKENEKRLLASEKSLNAKLFLIEQRYGDLINDHHSLQDKLMATTRELAELKHQQTGELLWQESQKHKIDLLESKLKIINQLTKGIDDAKAEINKSLQQHTKVTTFNSEEDEYLDAAERYNEAEDKALEPT